MRVAIVTTYPPRPCGIGMFSHDLREALVEADPGTPIEIVSILRDARQHAEPEVVASIRQDVRSDYAAVAADLTSRGTDVVLIEHEYGIFGGEAGAFVVSLAEELEQPLVVTLHTVLSEPSERQADTLRALCDRATLVTVFTETARRMVVDAGIVAPDRVRVLPHGAPKVLVDARAARAAAPEHLSQVALERLEGRTVLSTFGLISAGKGIELAIAALPAIVAAHPEVLYLVAGQTHPEVVKHEGESYRLGLERLVRELDLTEHVHFLDRFFTEAELAVLLASTDLYLTPYRSKEQIVSGALTFAVAAGCPVVSTPYYYAEDLLASGAGVLVPFDDPAAMSAAVLDLLDHPDELGRARAEAQRVGVRAGLDPDRRQHPAGAGRRRRAGTGAGRRPEPARLPGPHHPPRPPAQPGRRRRHHPARQRHRGQPLDRLLRRRRGPARGRRARAATASCRTRRTRGCCNSRPRLPAARLGLLADGDAQLHDVRPTLGRRRPPRRPPGSGGLGARRGGRRHPRPAGGGAVSAAAGGDGPGAG